MASDIYSHVPLDAFEPWYLYYLTVDELHRVATAVTEFKRLVSMLQQDPRLSQFYEAMSLMLEDMSVANAAEQADMKAFIPTLSRITAGMAVVATDQSPDASESSPWAAAFFDDEVLAQVEDEMRGQGYQMFLNGRMFVALVHPRGLADAGVAHGATIAKLRRILNDVRETFPDVQISLTGEPVLDHDEMQSSQQHALRATLLTLGLIAALFAVGFHELLRPLLAVVSMVLVVVISLGYATLTVGHLNLITVTFAVMILGLGIDLGIQFIARYEEELHRGVDRPGAIRTSIEETGPSIVTAGLTNAAAFFAMGLSGFRGITELGIIAGGGMLIATVVTLLVLPALLLAVRRQAE